MPIRAILAGVVAAVTLLPATVAAADPRPVAPGPDLPFTTAHRDASRNGPIGRAKLQRQLEALARRAPSSSGYFVHDLDAGRRGDRVLFDRSENHPRKLASNQKLFTTLTAMHRLGPDSRITTKVKVRGGVSRKGKLGGDVHLVGSGDPTLRAGGVAALARQVRRSGIRKVSGTVIADDSVFDRRRGVADSGYGASPYIAPLSGLTYGGSTYSGDPAKAAARAFRAALREAGVRIAGKVELGRVPASIRDTEPTASFDSPKIGSIARATNKNSDNFYAEMLLKRLWAEPGRKGTTNGGAKAVERFAKDVGSGVRARDGSGLTDSNRSSPHDVVRLLASAQRDDELAKPLFRSLAIAGKDGTLDNRMEGSPAAGRCRGKTGTIDGVSNLSGYCRSDGGLIAFSLLMNGVSNYDAARHIQDKMVASIARYR